MLIDATSRPAGKPDVGPLPLVIGVTGHRDIRARDRPRLQDQVRGVLQSFVNHYPRTPVVLLSALAPGADQLAAEVALSMSVRVVAVLPMPLELYELDFAEADGSRAIFRALLGQARPCMELPLLDDRAKVEQPGPERERQYEALGAYLVRHSQVLIALWDGKERLLRGGTASVVGFRLRGVPQPYSPPRGALDAIEDGPVFHLVSPRESDEGLVDGALDPRTMWPDSVLGAHDDASDTSMRLFEDVFSRMDVFNTDAATRAASLSRKHATCVRQLIGERDAADLPIGAQSILRLYAVADTLAGSFQRILHWQLPVLFAVGGVSAVALALFAHVTRAVPLLAVYIVLLLTAFAWLLGRMRFESIGDRYLEYRALAEALRVQFFWEVGGLHEAVADHYLLKQRDELRWIRIASRNAFLPDACAGAGSCIPAADAFGTPQDTVERELIQQNWLEDQRRYFAARAVQNEAALHRSHRRMVVSLLLALLCAWALFALVSYRLQVPEPLAVGSEDLAALIAAATGGSTDFEEKPPQIQVQDFLIVLTALFVLVAAAHENYADKKAWSQERKQYQRMHDVYSLASYHFRAGGPEAEGARLEVLRELGREALAENGDWVVLHRGRIPELLVSG